jgi:hypothetical protein
MSSKPGPSAKACAAQFLCCQVLAKRRYFGRIVGSPPGLPGGGITGVLPVSGVGARICGSTPAGGHNTPSDLAILSPSGSRTSPVVIPCGIISPVRGADGNGAQSPAGAGGAVRAGGVAGVGGACALAAPDTANTHKIVSERFIRILEKRPARLEVPRKKSRLQDLR